MKVVRNIVLTLLTIAFVVAVVWVTRLYKQEVVCTAVEFAVQSEEEPMYTVAELEQMLRTIITDSLVGKKMVDINYSDIENCFANPLFTSVAVFSSVSGKITIEVTERVPQLWLQFANGKSCYVDKNGMLMPVKKRARHHLLVVSGHIKAADFKFDKQVISIEEVADSTLLKVWDLAQKVTEDEFLSHFIGQLWVDKKGEVLLSPIIGRHYVEFGLPEKTTKKLEKLKLFYDRGINNAGWKNYRKVSLKFSNQIVCSKK